MERPFGRLDALSEHRPGCQADGIGGHPVALVVASTEVCSLLRDIFGEAGQAFRGFRLVLPITAVQATISWRIAHG